MDIANKAKTDVLEFAEHVELLDALADFADKVDADTHNSFALLYIHHSKQMRDKWAELQPLLMREIIPLASDIKSLRVAS